MDDHYRGARPGRGHLAFVQLHRAGRLAGLVTQNIDNLHQESGLPSQSIVELHGNGSYATCLDCARRYELDWCRARFEATGHGPVCEACDGFVKSATISFGQAMPEEAMRRAHALAQGCDLFLAVGSSLVVFPAAGFPLLAKRAGARLVILNREPTELDDEADLVINAEIGEVLPAAIEHVADALAPGRDA
jgi:NAD-dependent deacetylase